ncbi:AraC family transcriptional regulator [Marinomonas dokdonensis]|uniref:AraC family transcriptional regulator n=1 Tax=Marinomonas dokdonensis TaxID=328224 RepID=UPI00405599F9
MNKLESILENFSIQSDVIFNGNFCGQKMLGVEQVANSGHLHYLRSGKVSITCQSGHKMHFDQPSLIFLPATSPHYLMASDLDQAELICARVDFTALEQQKMIASLPKLVSVALADSPMEVTVDWLFREIGGAGLGQKALVTKLCDILMIQVFRHLSDEGLVIQGVLAGLSHPQLSKLMVKLQDSVEEVWSLESMAEQAGMSRSKFAEVFRETVGQTPNDFLTDLRLNHAQQLLLESKPVSLVANQVGYEQGSVLARVFRKKLGMSPKEWLKKNSTKD